MSKTKDGAWDCLFLEEGARLLNIKFCRGDREVISPDELRAQVHTAVMSKKLHPNAALSKPPHSGQPQVDVREFVADL